MLPQTEPSPLIVSDSAPATATTLSQDASRATTTESFPRMRQLTNEDAEEVAQRLERAAMHILITHPVRDDAICIGASSFLPRTFINRITTDFFDVNTEAVLRQRMHGWRFEWEEYGADLWRAVCELREEFGRRIRERHEASGEERREADAQD